MPSFTPVVLTMPGDVMFDRATANLAAVQAHIEVTASTLQAVPEGLFTHLGDAQIVTLREQIVASADTLLSLYENLTHPTPPIHLYREAHADHN